MKFNWVRIKYNWQKYNWLFLILFMLCLIIPIWVLDYQKLKSTPKYSIGVTLKSSVAKGYMKEIDYYFYIKNQRIKGEYVYVFKKTTPLIVPDGKYLVVYAKTDPSINLFLFDKPIEDTINLDSLNAIGVHEDDIRFWGL